MVDALVQHEGLGMVIGYADDMTAVALGKGGQRNLHTGEVIGDRPGGALCPGRRARRGHARDAHLAVAAGHGLSPCRRPVADQHGLPRRHRGGAGRTCRQPRRVGRRTDRRLHLPSGGHGGHADAQRHRCLPYSQQPAQQAGGPQTGAGGDTKLPTGRQATCSAASARSGNGSAMRSAAWSSSATPMPPS